MDVGGPPDEWLVTRWDGAFPQYPAGHLARVARIHDEVASLPGLALAGASYQGVGIPACVGSGRGAGRQVRAAVTGTPDR